MIRPHLVVDAALAGTTLGLGAALGLGWPFAALGAMTLGLQAWATVSPRSSWYLPLHWRLPCTVDGFCLTFDDGPHAEHTPRVLDLLAEHGQRATFFVIGEHVQRHAALVRRICAGGHTLGLHSHGHSRWFNLWPPGRVRDDLQRCASAVADATGSAPPRLFRPPVGLKNPLVAQVVEQLDLLPVTWSARVWDTRGATSAAIARRLERALRPRAIVLLHDGHEPGFPGDRSPTVAALAATLPRLAGHSRPLVPAGRGVTLAA